MSHQEMGDSAKEKIEDVKPAEITSHSGRVDGSGDFPPADVSFEPGKTFFGAKPAGTTLPGDTVLPTVVPLFAEPPMDADPEEPPKEPPKEGKKEKKEKREKGQEPDDKIIRKTAAVDSKVQAKMSRTNLGMAEKTTAAKPGSERSGIPAGGFLQTGDIAMHIGQTEYILLTVRDFFLYSILVTVVTVIAVASMPTSRYYYHDIFTHFLTDSNFKTESGLYKNFWDIRILDQIWDYWKGILIPLTYSGVNDRIAKTFAANLKEDHLMILENVVVVLPRIRQVRVRNDSCQVPEGFVYIFDSCHYFFSPELEDREPFGLGNGTLWTWQSDQVTKSSSVSGEISTYTGGGYFMDFSMKKEETLALYTEMWNNTWIDHGSRAIIVDVVGYTQRDNLFCIVTLLFEIPPSGGVITSGDIRIQKLLRYVSTTDFVVLGFEAALLVLLVYYTVEETVELIIIRLKYFKNPWNIFDFVILVLGYSTLAVGALRYFMVENELKGLRDAMRNHEFFSFHEVRKIQTAYEVLIGTLALGVWLKIFKYMYVVRPGAIVLRAFQKVRMELLALTLMLLLLVFGFAMFAHVIFGTHVEEFNSIGSSMFTLIALFSGGLYFYKNCEEARPMLAPAFFILYIFVVILLFLNWFAAAIVHGLKRAAKDFDATGDDEQVFLKDILRNALKKMFLICGYKRMYKKMDDEDRAYQDRPDYDIIINLLKRNGFGILERALFLKRHGISEENTTIPKSKVDDVIADLNGMNKLYVEVEEHAKIMEQVDKIKKRLEILDHALSDMVVKSFASSIINQCW
ncbi:hypothetical protein GE061_017736 [Apolygus lucorum]|uniref:Polycystin cation channel PKD1/PKD2 domain-containing protein n=1 Tax=Apolygus lucorum TaxID=248454 RepID=A0A8S9XC01_APOLU|nr:hypothetical protein GE061_017736 [Apolygus lucorum]